MEIERALEYVELYGLYTECEAIYQVDNLMSLWDRSARRRPGGVRLRPAQRRLGAATSTRSTCRRSSQHARVKTDARQVAHARPHGPAAQAGARPEAPRRRVRPREHADRVERGRELLVPRHAPAQRARAGALRAAHARRGARSAQARQARPHRLPAPLLPALRGRSGRPDRRGRARDDDAADPHQELSRGLAPRSRAPRRRAPHGADHRCAVVQRRRAEAAVRRDRGGRDERASRRHLLRRDDDRAAHRRGAGTDSSPTTATPRASGSTSASPTPTRRATCRCSKRSASRSRSTPRPGWRRSPASAAGWSSTGRRRPAVRGRCSRSAR